jgi:hypothetical protein
MESGTLLSDLNFPRRLNKELRPVIQNANISSPRGPASSIFITGIPYAVDTYRQFLTPVYAIYNAMDRNARQPAHLNARLIQEMICVTPTIQTFMKESIDLGNRIMDVSGVAPKDEGMNLAILNCDGISDGAPEWTALRDDYTKIKLHQTDAAYDQLVYPLIFWQGQGGCGILTDEDGVKASNQIRKVLICLMLQPRGHFIHAMETLREKFLCATYEVVGVKAASLHMLERVPQKRSICSMPG